MIGSTLHNLYNFINTKPLTSMSYIISIEGKGSGEEATDFYSIMII